MSDYLSRIVARNLNMAEVVQPRLWSLFEPPSADGGQVFEEHSGYGERDEVFVSDEPEAYLQTSMSPLSPPLADRSADSALADVVWTETAQRKAADPRTSIQNKPRPNLEETEEHQIPEMTEKIPVAISSPKNEVASPDQNRSDYSAAVKAEPPRTVSRKAIDAQPLTPETIRGETSQGRPFAYQNKIETIPATVSEKTQRTDPLAPTLKSPKQTPPDQRQTASSEVTVKTETVGTVHRKAADSQTPSPETIVSSSRPDLVETKSRPYPKMMEAIPAMAKNETEIVGSPSPSQKAPKQTPPDQRQTTSTAVTVKTETVRRRAVGNQSFLPGSIPNLPRQESGEAKRQPSPEKETTIVTAKSKIATQDLWQQEPPLAEVGFETDRRARQKVADVQPRASEPIQSLPPSDLEITQRRPGPENATYLEVATEVHPSSRRVQLPSGPEIDRSPKVGIDGERGTRSSRVAAERELLLAPSSRAQAISPPEVTRFVAPKDSTKTQPTETNPTIQVKIGRVEVRAAAPTGPTPPPSRGAPQPAPKLSLDEYLKQRDGGRR
ncbi:MAG TPA: hypothetical protein PLM24_00050 [Methanothrix sp.]|nr:hypothetical protein [Methanothrix sp.]HPJ83478.1 hypothetical protein [Methanothrix sp.]HPR65507.1 hypothetical protein [Methanothrix sp.]